MRKILVTGASGQLGLAIKEKASYLPELQFYFKDKSEVDITKSREVNDTLMEIRPDYCINCAAYTNVEQAEHEPEPAFAVNSEGAEILAKACSVVGATLIHISTDYVFDGDKATPYTVNDLPNPINKYGRSKWEGEIRIAAAMDQYYIVRTSWLYSNNGKNFYTTILKKARENNFIEVTDEQKGCPTHADNLAGFILNDLILGQPAFGIYHYTDGVPMSWYEFARKILIEHNLDKKVTVKKANNYRTFAARPKNSVLA